MQSGELPVLPLSINGAVAMMHLPNSDSFVDGDRFFVYKFDKTQAGLAGLSFDEGAHPPCHPKSSSLLISSTRCYMFLLARCSAPHICHSFSSVIVSSLSSPAVLQFLSFFVIKKNVYLLLH